MIKIRNTTQDFENSEQKVINSLIELLEFAQYFPEEFVIFASLYTTLVEISELIEIEILDDYRSEKYILDPLSEEFKNLQIYFETLNKFFIEFRNSILLTNNDIFKYELFEYTYKNIYPYILKINEEQQELDSMTTLDKIDSSIMTHIFFIDIGTQVYEEILETTALQIYNELVEIKLIEEFFKEDIIQLVTNTFNQNLYELKKNSNTKNIYLFLFENDFFFILPEIFLSVFIIYLLIFNLIFNNNNNKNNPNLLIFNIKIGLFFFIISFILLINNNFLINQSIEINLFFNLLILNNFINVIKLIINGLLLIFSFFLIVYFKKDKLISYEFYILILLSILGMYVLLMSNDFLIFYLGLELQSLSFYILATFYRNTNFSTEAGLKYFILGAIASTLLLLGFSIIYAFTGITNFTDLELFNKFLTIIDQDQNYIKLGIFFGLLLISISIFFKIGVAPFHFWIPDVYEGISTIILLFFVLFPKLIFLSILCKLYFLTFFVFSNELSYLLLFVSILSIFLGNILGLYQTKIKRLFAYSAISNIGFLTLGLSLLKFETFFVLFFYLFIYIILIISFFSFLLILKTYTSNTELKTLTSLKNLYNVNPMLAIMFALTLFSFAGIPPLMGFFIKLTLFYFLLVNNYFFVSIFVILLTAISSFYYIRLIKIMFFDTKSTKWIFLKPIPKSISYIISICFIFNLYFFINLSQFVDIIRDIILTFYL